VPLPAHQRLRLGGQLAALPPHGATAPAHLASHRRDELGKGPRCLRPSRLLSTREIHLIAGPFRLLRYKFVEPPRDEGLHDLYFLKLHEKTARWSPQQPRPATAYPSDSVKAGGDRMYWPREESDIRLGKPKLQPCNDPGTTPSAIGSTSLT
jgi:hypothetical protein